MVDLSDEIGLDDDAPAAHERRVHDPGEAWKEAYQVSTPEEIGSRKGMVDRHAVQHDEYGEHPPSVTSRASFLTFAAMFRFSPADLDRAADAWERAFYQLDRVRSLPSLF